MRRTSLAKDRSSEEVQKGVHTTLRPTLLSSFCLSSDALSTLEKFYGKSITLADREIVEAVADDIL